jgi:hypothetical protein
MNPPLERLAARRPLLHWLLLATLCLGAIAHYGHHWLDPDCDSNGSASHPCACSGLHGAVEPEADLAALPAPPLSSSWTLQSIPDASPAAAHVTTSPRAPPLA